MERSELQKMEKRCRNCKWFKWSQLGYNYGDCKNEHWRNISNDYTFPSDPQGVIYSWASDWEIGPDFGCIHFEPKETGRRQMCSE